MAKQAPRFYAMLEHVMIPLLQLTDLEKHSVTSVAQQVQISAWIKG